jgi:hypothetical protein
MTIRLPQLTTRQEQVEQILAERAHDPHPYLSILAQTKLRQYLQEQEDGRSISSDRNQS